MYRITALFLLFITGNVFACCGTPVVPPPSYVHLTYQGNSPATIHQYFPSVIENNFNTNPVINVMFAKLTDVEVALLARQYTINTKGVTAPLTAIAMRRLNAANLARYKSAIANKVTGAVNPLNGSPAAALAMGVSEQSIAPYVVANGNPAPNADMTLYEIYLEYRTASNGALTMEAAVAETAMFAAMRLTSAFGLGYTIGQVATTILYYINPNIETAVDDAMQALLDSLKPPTFVPPTRPGAGAGSGGIGWRNGDPSQGIYINPGPVGYGTLGTIVMIDSKGCVGGKCK